MAIEAFFSNVITWNILFYYIFKQRSDLYLNFEAFGDISHFVSYQV